MALKKHTAPKYLPESKKKEWQAKYDAALAKAKVDYADNESAQLAAAHKDANKMLSIPAPQSAAEIDKLEPWQIVKDSRKTVLVDGEEHRTVVTIDGKKHKHPVKK